MLLHDTQENRNNSVEIKEADPGSVKKCIDFIYSGKTTVSTENSEQLMYTAKLMQLEGLCEQIVKFPNGELDKNSMSSAMTVAKLYDYKDLGGKCQKYAIENFEECAANDHFKQLSKDEFKALVKSKHLEVFETVKCDAIISWVKHDIDGRKKYLPSLLKHLDMSKIPLNYCCHIMENEPLFYENTEFLKKFSFAVFDGMKVKPSRGVSVIAMFDEASKRFYAFDPASKKWKPMQGGIMTYNGTFTAVVVFDSIYVMMNQAGYLFQMDYKDMNAEWKKMTKMKYSRNNLQASVLDGSIFV